MIAHPAPCHFCQHRWHPQSSLPSAAQVFAPMPLMLLSEPFDFPLLCLLEASLLQHVHNTPSYACHNKILVRPIHLNCSSSAMAQRANGHNLDQVYHVFPSTLGGILRTRLACASTRHKMATFLRLSKSWILTKFKSTDFVKTLTHYPSTGKN